MLFTFSFSAFLFVITYAPTYIFVSFATHQNHICHIIYAHTTKKNPAYYSRYYHAVAAAITKKPHISSSTNKRTYACISKTLPFQLDFLSFFFGCVTNTYDYSLRVKKTHATIKMIEPNLHRTISFIFFFSFVCVIYRSFICICGEWAEWMGLL